MKDRTQLLEEALAERILLLDGGLGTMVQGFGLDEAAYRGERFVRWEHNLLGCNDVLSLTAPAVLTRIHEAYLEAGADLITTDSFNANAVSMADYALEPFVYEINLRAARLARAAADRFTAAERQRPRFVAGSMGPTNRTASMSADVNDPAGRQVTFARLAEAYAEQARGLLDGGADVLLIETVFDTLNAKAALFAVDALCTERGVRIPVMVSGTLADASGRTLSGQTVEAFRVSVSHARLLSVGFNCAYGARQLLPYLERLAAVADCRISAHPNAGLPNLAGGYDETPEMFARDVEEYMRRGLVNIVGGCCGTTPAHIRALGAVVGRYAPRPLPVAARETLLSGLEVLRIAPESNFVNAGERTNVAGSARFARLVREGDFEGALAVARSQVEAGAQLIDVCMDGPLIDAPAAMERFLNLVASDPDTARVPVMIDSSSWEVLEAGLRCTQGKSLVNSVSLKEGEEELLRRTRLIRRYGAAAVVMLFDERGQADTFERKIEVAARAYRLLTADGFPPEDIVFDANVLAIATGMAEHDRYALDFIEATRWIKANLPRAKVSAGVSNLSFAFRGNNAVREAMHAAFLYHATQAGLDMGIVNPALLRVYTDIDPELLALAEDAVLCRRPDAGERLAAWAARTPQGEATGDAPAPQAARSDEVERRIADAMLRGADEHIAQDALEACRKLGSPLEVIDRMLMPAMERVGELFGQGKMFLPQVVRSARVMKRAVGALAPLIEAGAAQRRSAGKVLLATVKGDVHDIGKNIVSVVIACNGYSVRDLGVMVPCERIVEEAVAWGADAVGLSGLITPSLEEMIRVAREMERRGLLVPLIIGGATTSALHTAVKIAPEYGGAVIHSRDASDNVRILARLTGPGRAAYLAEVATAQRTLREEYARAQERRNLLPLAAARANRRPKQACEVVVPAHTGRLVFPDVAVESVERYIDWNFFFSSWGLRERYPDLLESPRYGEQARRLFDDAQALLGRIREERLLTLQGVVGIYPAAAEGDDIVVRDARGRSVRLAQLRNQQGDAASNPSLADYVMDASSGVRDYVGAFAVTAGVGLDKLAGELREQGDDYNAIMAKLLADRLTEALAEAMHRFVRREMWGYESGPPAEPQQVIAGGYQGVRMAFGYPASPDHSLKREVFELLGVERTTSMTLTENYMISPGEALCGLIFAGPEARYFAVGPVDEEQRADYARRRGLTPERVRSILGDK